MADLYCTVFVSAEMARSSLAEVIALHLKSEAKGSLVSGASMEIEVLDNEDFDPGKIGDPEKGFLFYPLCLDIEPAQNAVESDYIHDVAQLLSALRSRGYKAVAACDFEEQLPREGQGSFARDS